MFKAMQSVTVTDGDGVQDNCGNGFLFEYFLCQRKGMNRHVKRFFEMNDSVNTRDEN
jgi:hypothetical protein